MMFQFSFRLITVGDRLAHLANQQLQCCYFCCCCCCGGGGGGAILLVEMGRTTLQISKT